jgi:hypothetical protein
VGGDYAAAIAGLRELADLARRVVLLGSSERQPDLVVAVGAGLVALRGGYRVTAAAPATAMLVLPVQFSHCWRIESATDNALPCVLRADMIQTGILFTGDLDVTMRFDFVLWRASCRLRDARDVARFDFR